MKKKIKELTLKEADELCNKHKCGDCPCCGSTGCLSPYFLLSKEALEVFEREVEIDE